MDEKESGTRLPKLIMRPFLCYLPEHVDDRTYVSLEVIGNLSLIVGAILNVITVIGLGFVAIALISLFANSSIELWAFITGVPLIFIGGTGSIWFYYRNVYDDKPGKYDIFYREEGIIRTTIFENKKKRIKAFPFEECYAELKSMNTPTIPLSQMIISIHHPSYAGMLHMERFNNLDAALGYWSFLVQYMDNQAPLPNVSWLTGYPNRTDGVGPADRWEAMQHLSGFTDPYYYWKNLCRFYRDQGKPVPGKLPEQFTPRAQTRVDVPGSAGNARPRTLLPGGKLVLPKKLLRPFVFENAMTADATSYHCKRLMEKGRYYAMAAWTVLCAGLGLLAASWWAGAPLILLAVCSSYALWYVKQTRGMILDRENGRVILHKGWLLKPLALPFDQCQGLLLAEKHPMGFSTSRLYLEHPEMGLHPFNDYSSAALDKEMGLWSFIVQYMDKTKPLPKIGPFENLPDADPGLGDWEDWSAKTTRPGFVDPLARWLRESVNEPMQNVPGGEKPDTCDRIAGITAANPTARTG